MLSLFDLLDEKKKDEPKEESFTITVGEREVPVNIIYEKRFNNRVSVNSNGILLRIAAGQPRDEKQKYIQQFLHWAKTRLDKNPGLLDALPQRTYVNGEILRVGQYDFRINIFYHEHEKSTARLFGDQIVISLARGLTKEAENNTNSYMVARCLSKFFHPIVNERLEELNRKYFGKNIQSLRLKYNTSNWGSCSTQGNINISLRLLFAPQEVIDYVLIHELAHLVHANHSPRFWALVAKIMPNYQQHEKHLEENNFKYYL
ncbi:MAG: M48 family metallopeptidase [Chitinophagales bacterium]